MIDFDGLQKRNVSNATNKIEMNPSFSPDGKIIVYDELNSGSIFLMTIE
jgi:Tol biopolymer transport system component